MKTLEERRHELEVQIAEAEAKLGGLQQMVTAGETKLERLQAMIVEGETKCDQVVGFLASKLRESVKGDRKVGALLRAMGAELTGGKAKQTKSQMH